MGSLCKTRLGQRVEFAPDHHENACFRFDFKLELAKSGYKLILMSGDSFLGLGSLLMFEASFYNEMVILGNGGLWKIIIGLGLG